MTPRLRALLVLHEGLRLKAYRCTAGKWTIGIGRNIEDNPFTPAELSHLGYSEMPAVEALTITREQAYWLLDNDLRKVNEQLSRRLPWFGQLEEVCQAVLIDMGFNLGIGGLLKFKLTLAEVAGRNYARAADMMLESNWARQVGKEKGQRAHRLSEMMRTGQWPDK